MITLDLTVPPRENVERVNLIAVLLMLNEIIESSELLDADFVYHELLPLAVRQLRTAITGHTSLASVLEQGIDSRDRRIEQLEQQLAETAVALDDERTLAERFAVGIRNTCRTGDAGFLLDDIESDVADFLLRF